MGYQRTERKKRPRLNAVASFFCDGRLTPAHIALPGRGPSTLLAGFIRPSVANGFCVTGFVVPSFSKSPQYLKLRFLLRNMSFLNQE
ncbi:hypothetical protein Gbem_4081 [Citrifermentans bemidjiense Bem]|uniref:Uncharacterized protein n=1 Tax=Citrifermentans bemidjiense (strain ATCC BAA-1014 / DSM 16622 / JCM 12645 / Bem) TaxID=404380 RepID=E1P688_CITBB|nr:hypothetical protein Gbem_4081 [Citrifermentans bemidjiense Bem]